MQQLYPKADARLIPAGSNDPEIIPVGAILHVDAGSAWSLFNWFNGPSGGIESHLHIRKDGSVEQYRVFGREADANGGGNSWIGRDGRRYGFISVETQGLGPGWWTKEQKAAIKDFLSWSSKEFGYPLRKVKMSRPGDVSQGGVGYHKLFDLWNAQGKPCPGLNRVRWFNNKLVPWMDEQRHEYHTVVSGDSILSVSRKYGITPLRLWQLNRELLKPGEKLRVR
jgi:hypothetical protein